MVAGFPIATRTYMHVLLMLSSPIPNRKDELLKIFRKFDTNADNSISYDEARQAMRDLTSSLAFRAFYPKQQFLNIFLFARKKLQKVYNGVSP